jgi:spoIIIJ-associated protein
MMPENQNQQIVDEGKSVDEAIEKGLERLGLSRDDVEVEVLEEGSSGLLNLIGAKQAKVILHPRDDSAEVRAKIDELVGGLMERMGVSCQVSIEVEDGIHRVNIESAGVDGLLIGKKGQNLDALSHLLRRMVGKQLRRSVRMDVDVGGYKDRRGESLRNKALSLASRVKSSGKEMQVEPLSAAERRIIHLTLAPDPEVKTFTIGDGDLKNVIIAPSRRGSRNQETRESAIER